MSVIPATLPSVGTTQYSAYVWRWRSSTSTHEIYDLETSGDWASTTQNIYSIRVDTSTNTWSDDGSSNPTDVTVSGTAFSAVTENSDGTVSLYGNSGGTNMLLYVFTKPTTASWISSGGGTSTEGVPIVEWSAAFSEDPGSSYWRWTVTGLNTDSTDYIYLYDYMPTLTSTDPPIGERTFSVSSSASTQYGLFTPDVTKTYYVINYDGTSSSTNLGAVVLASKNFGQKKVHSNFW